MEEIVSHEIELDGVKLNVHGCYLEGVKRSFFPSYYPNVFEIEYIFISGKKIDVDITDLIYYRTQEIEDLIIEQYYK
tara:strand:+ start:2029 stop:2259 length:231 start_codon:yes stop_codon:yes gene_type:complete